MIERVLQLDKDLFFLINGNQADWLNPIMLLLSSGVAWIPLYLGLVWLLYQKYGKAFYKHVLVLLIVFLLTDQTSSGLIKPLVERLRPCHEPAMNDHVQLLTKCGGKFSFPSGHATNTMGLAIGIYLLYGVSAGIWLILWAVLVGYSRIYLGVHYPLDVVAGFALGYLIAMLACGIARKSLKLVDNR